MTCHEVQISTSLYLYGELDFAQEEEFERHLAECALCQRTLDREKIWHTALRSSSDDVPLNLLTDCRQDLHTALANVSAAEQPRWWTSIWQRVSFPTGSLRLAMASFIFFVGFAFARWTEHSVAEDNGRSGPLQTGPLLDAGVLGPSSIRVRDVQSPDRDHIRIVIQQVRDGEVIGNMEDRQVRQLLLTASANSADPGVRIDSVEMLGRQVSGAAGDLQDGSDIRDVLLNSAQHDTNAAVRLKALEGLRRFSNDAAAREALKLVLQNDENAGVRSEAIDILAPLDRSFQLTPDLAGTLHAVMQSLPADDYVHARCQQVLQTTNTVVRVY
jgi:anti-sigma factor RsiW